MLKYLPIFDIVQLYIHILLIHSECVLTYLYVFNKYCFLSDHCFTFVILHNHEVLHHLSFHFYQNGYGFGSY